MKWSKTKIGSKRVVKRFAFLPKCCKDIDKVVWLEFVYEKQEYVEFYCEGFCNICWVTKEVNYNKIVEES